MEVSCWLGPGEMREFGTYDRWKVIVEVFGHTRVTDPWEMGEG